MMELHRATKTKSKLRIGLAGTSGSGKTYSALLLASGMTSWNKICVIDTENQSADLYDHLGEYNVLTLQEPYSPERYIEAINVAEQAGMEVIIIDSITHEWSGVGGCLQIVEQVTKASASKNSYTAWGKVTPRHTAFLEAILRSPCHIITTVRRKQDYSMGTNEKGNMVITKMGLAEITREGFEYELTLSFNLTQNHLAEASKDRTGLFMDKPEFIITSDIGKTLIKWANEGIEAHVVEKINVEPQSELKETNNIPIIINDFQKKKLLGFIKKEGVKEEEWLTQHQYESLDTIPFQEASMLIGEYMKKEAVK